MGAAMQIIRLTIKIFAFDGGCVVNVEVSWRAPEGTAKTCFCATHFQINRCALAPLTSIVMSIVLLEVAGGSHKLVALCPFVTAYWGVSVTARQAGTIERLGRGLLDPSFGAWSLETRSLLLTTCRSIGIDAFSIGAKNICSIAFVHPVCGAFVSIATSFGVAASVSVMCFTSGIDALDDLSIALVHIEGVANVGVAKCPEVTAKVAVVFAAHKTFAPQLVSIPLVDIAVGTRVCVAHVLLRTTRVVVTFDAGFVILGFSWTTGDDSGIVPVQVTGRASKRVAHAFCIAASVIILWQACTVDTHR
jgi:hypothetical protein